MTNVELLIVLIQSIGVANMIVSKNGWYPDMLRYGLLKIERKLSNKPKNIFYLPVAKFKTDDDGEVDYSDQYVEYDKFNDSFREWFRFLRTCSLCVAFWFAWARLNYTPPFPIDTFLTALGLSSIVSKIIDSQAIEPDN